MGARWWGADAMLNADADADADVTALFGVMALDARVPHGS